mmetsp:Transcript_11005/g.33742  ORF Transcript_11005/g.33742 Transcript_11005/m.33742 type:complete len:243 (-) Transcript_11005:2409-3137(-)
MVSAEELRQAIKEFHSAQVDPQRREELQHVLLQTLWRPESLQLAASVLRPENEDLDPQLGFFCAIILDDICRKRFESIPASDRYGIAASLFAVLAKQRYPDYVDAKLADVIVQFGKREIALNSGMHENFLDRSMAAAASADFGSCTAALEVLASAVQNLSDTRRSDLLSKGKRIYRQQLREKEQDILATLSRGLLLSDDRLSSMCVEAIQSMFTNVARNHDVQKILQLFRRQSFDVMVIGVP